MSSITADDLRELAKERDDIRKLLEIDKNLLTNWEGISEVITEVVWGQEDEIN